jgi:hypothetical protein
MSMLRITTMKNTEVTIDDIEEIVEWPPSVMAVNGEDDLYDRDFAAGVLPDGQAASKTNTAKYDAIVANTTLRAIDYRKKGVAAWGRVYIANTCDYCGDGGTVIKTISVDTPQP